MKSEKELEKLPFEKLLFGFGPTEKTKHSYEQAKKEEEMKYKNRKRAAYVNRKYNKLQNRNQQWRSKSAKNKAWRQPKIDRFAKVKRLVKQWERVDRRSHKNYMGYINADFRLQKVYKGFSGKRGITGRKKEVTPWLAGFYKLQQAPTFNAPLLNQVATNLALQKYTFNHKITIKQPLSIYDKVFYYYTLQTPLTMYAHKAFILLEMQLNATLVRAKLVPYLFMVRDLCFYRLVYINNLVARTPHQVISLYDSVSLPVYLHNYMYYRHYRLQYYPKNIGLFFKKYWAHFTNYTNNKVWLLSNFITSDITAEAVIFDYPNITLYMGPFKRFTKLYYKNHPYAPTGQHRHLNYTHTVLKLKLFEYAAFYR